MKQINHYFKSASPILQLVPPVPKPRVELGTELHGAICSNLFPVT